MKQNLFVKLRQHGLRFGMFTGFLFAITATGPAASAAGLQTEHSGHHAAAVAAQPSEALRTRVNQVIEIFNGQRPLQDFFGPGVPVERYEQNLNRVRTAFGAAVSVSGLEAATPNSGTFTVKFERGERRMKLRVADEAPHTVSDFGSAN